MDFSAPRRRVASLLVLMALGFTFAGRGNAQTSSTALGIFEAQSDVGDAPKPGSGAFDAASAEYRVAGGGANMWGAKDSFHFVWKKIAGDFDFSATVQFIGEGSAEHRKAVLVVRQSLEANSAYADIALHGDGLIALQYRPAAGAETSEVRSLQSDPRPFDTPANLRLKRHGAQLMVYAGKHGEGPFPSGPITVEFKGPVYVGLGLCSHDANVLETAVFSEVALHELPATANDLNPTKVHSDLSVFDLATKTVSVIYSADTLWEAPNWTPDGKYLMSNSGGKLYRIAANGTGSAAPEPVGLDAGYAANNDHGLSPDGKWLAISAEHGGAEASQVYVADANGARPRLITPNMPSYFHGWSPDGKWLAFVGERGKNFDIYRIPVDGGKQGDGGKEERLTSDPGFDDGPDYSVDGKWIYINSNRAGGWDIWRFPADGAGPGDDKAERITNDAQEDWFPHPSPDGKWIAFLSFPPGTPGHDTKTSVHLRLMPASAGPVAKGGATIEDWSDSIETLTEFFGGQGTINVNSWSPDSKKFAFVSYRLLP